MYIEHPYKYDGKYSANVDGKMIEITKEVAYAMNNFYRSSQPRKVEIKNEKGESVEWKLREIPYSETNGQDYEFSIEDFPDYSCDVEDSVISSVERREILGKETIDLYNTSDTRGSQRSYGMNYQKTGKELMSQDEIAVMDGGKCILQVRGVRPFFSNKYDICKHKNYKYLSDYDKKNTFDIEKYLSTNLILKPEDEVELYQM